MNYVNYRGEQIGLVHHDVAKKPKKERGSYHNGWRVQGVPPGALEEAKEENRRLAALNAKAGGKAIPDFDPDRWLMNAKRKPVRARPFEIPAAAQECKSLAERAGWLRVEIVELKKEASVA